MIPTPIRQVLLTFQRNGVQALLMGGQACVFYGAAQVSKDVDFVLLAERGNYDRLRAALDAEVRAEKAQDRAYWEPLRREIEAFRREERKEDPGAGI